MLGSIDELTLEEQLRELGKVDENYPDKQWKICIHLGNRPDAKNNQTIIKALIEALDEPKHFALTRAYAAEALGKLEIKDEKAVKRLVRSLKEDSVDLVRSKVAKALGNIDDEAAIPALVEALGKPDEFFGVRAESASALKMICSNRSTDTCKKARQDVFNILMQIADDYEKGDIDRKKKEGLIRILKEFIPEK